MSTKRNNLQGLDDLNNLFESITEPKFRARALRNAAKVSMEPVKDQMVQEAPSMLKDHVKTKIKVNTNRNIKIPKNGFIKEDKYNELFAEVTFDTKRGIFGKESAYGMAAILNYGRHNPLAKINSDTKFHAFGKETDESHRYIGTTEGKHFIDKVRFETENDLAQNFGDELLKQVESEIKKQDKRKNRNR